MESENRKRKAEDIGASTEDESPAAAGDPLVAGEEELKSDEAGLAKRAKVSSEEEQDPQTASCNEDADKKADAASETIKAAEAGDGNNATISPKEDEPAMPIAEDKKAVDNKTATTDENSKGSVFGSTSGFSGFASVKGSSGGFGFGGTSKNGNSAFGGGGGFGSSGDKPTGFGSLGNSLSFGSAKGFGEIKTSSGSAFGAATTSAKNAEDDAAETETSTAPANTTGTISSRPIVELPTNYEIKSGEEDEIVLFEGRCKTRRLVPPGSKAETDHEAAGLVAKAPAAAPAVPPSQSLVGSNMLGTDSSTSSENTWQEVGTGPMKVLKHVIDGKIRLVQRREVTPSGPATKVLVNAPLHRGDLTRIFQPSEKHVQWATPIDGKAVTYLFRFATVKEATEMTRVLEESQKPLDDASSN